MKKLFKFEFRKLLHSRSFYTCLIICLVYALLQCIILKMVKESHSKDELALMSCPSMLFYIIMAVFCSIFATEDDESGALKNIYAKGFSKVKVSFVKYVVIILASLVFFVLATFLGYILGLIFFNSNTTQIKDLGFILLKRAFVTVALASFCTTIALLFNRLPATMTFNIIIPIVLSLILVLVDMPIKQKWPDTKFSIAAFELTNMFEAVANESYFVNIIAASIIYTIIFGVCGYFLSKKKEL